MPKYTFRCETCGKTKQAYTSVHCKTIKCYGVCSAVMDRQMPKLRGVRNTEVVDKFTNKKHINDHDEILKERKADYYWEVEVPKLVASGTYALDTMLEQNWVYYNEKGELVTRTKPPQKT